MLLLYGKRERCTSESQFGAADDGLPATAVVEGSIAGAGRSGVCSGGGVGVELHFQNVAGESPARRFCPGGGSRRADADVHAEFAGGKGREHLRSE